MRGLEARLLDDVRARRAADPRGALYLVVPSRFLGLHLRRRLARVLGGVLGLHVLTLPDLADRVAGLALALAGRRPLPPVADRLVASRAIEEAIPRTGGYFSAVAGFRNFPAALRRTLLDLKKAGVTAGALRAGAPDDPKIGELAACQEAAESALAGHRYYDATDLMVEATRRLAADPGELGAAAVFVFGFLELNPTEAGLLRACGGAAEVRHYPADAAAAVLPAPGAITIVAAPGEEREVREIARVVLAHAAEGGRFDEIGILVRQPGAYRAAVRDVFDAAGIPYTWGVSPAVGETRAGRSLRLLAEIRRAEFSRASVMEFLAFADLRAGPGVSPAEWERLSRQAGIVQGARAWLDRLERLGRRLGPAPGPAGPAGPVGPAEPAEDEAEEGFAGRVRDREALAALRRVAGVLTRGLGRLPDQAPIADLARRLAVVFRRLVAPSTEATQALGALLGLGGLDPVAPRVTLDEFWALLDDALASPASPDHDERAGRVFVGELGQTLGLHFPVTIVPGVVEGGFPAAAREDPILLDAERRRHPGLPVTETERALERLRFRLAVGSGARRLVLTYPRIDAGSGRPRVPSFFLLDLLEEVTGRRHDFAALETFPGWRGVALHPAPPAARGRPVDEREWLLARALAARPAPAAFLGQHPAAARGVAAIRARESSGRLTAYDGLLAHGVELGDAPLAPTALETYATCPFKYFLGHVLGVRPVEEPDRVLTLGARDRGTLVHRVLRDAFGRLAAAGLLPLTAARRPEAGAALDAALDEAFLDAERAGMTGLPALWEGEKTRIRAELHAALAAEVVDGAAWVPTLFEVGVGLPPGAADERPAPPASHALPDGTVLRFRGRLDRLDLSPDGARARVVDYKTGRVRGPRAPDRLQGGRALQLPIYRLAAAALLEDRGLAAVVDSAQYYHVIGRDAGARVRFSRDGWTARREDFERVVATIVDGIRAGRFFLRPGVCAGRRPCDFDLACGAERARWAEAKAGDPAAARHAELDLVP